MTRSTGRPSAQRTVASEPAFVCAALRHFGRIVMTSFMTDEYRRARGLVDNVNVREPLKPLGDGADAEIRAAVKASGLTVVREAVAA